MSMLEIVAESGSLDLVRRVLNQRSLTQYQIDNALTLAAKNNHFPVVEELLNRGANIHAWSDSALRSVAVDTENIPMIRYLISRGADVNTQEGLPLVEAAQRGHALAIQELLNNGADVHARNDKAIVEAARICHLSTVRELVGHGANVQTEDNEPLYLASWRCSPDIIRELLDHGADINSRNGIVLIRVVEKRNLPLIKELLERGANFNLLPEHLQDDYAYLVAIPINIKTYYQLESTFEKVLFQGELCLIRTNNNWYILNPYLEYQIVFQSQENVDISR
jgi:ankyrin repeat protein